MTKTSRRWLARGAFAALLAAAVVVIAAEGLTGLALTVVGLLGAAVVLAGGYWFIAKHGVMRWLGLTLAAVALVHFVLVFFWQGVVAVALISLGLLIAGGAAARAALRHEIVTWMPAMPAPAVEHAFIVMNPRSGGGKVVCVDLAAKARAMGAVLVSNKPYGAVQLRDLGRRARIDRGVLGVITGRHHCRRQSVTTTHR